MKIYHFYNQFLLVSFKSFFVYFTFFNYIALHISYLQKVFCFKMQIPYLESLSCIHIYQMNNEEHICLPILYICGQYNENEQAMANAFVRVRWYSHRCRQTEWMLKDDPSEPMTMWTRICFQWQIYKKSFNDKQVYKKFDEIKGKV